MTILDLVKTKNTSKLTDSEIQGFIDESEVMIKNYCNIAVIPDGLLYIWRDITLGLMDNSDDLDELSDIKVGDISVKFKTDVSSIFSNHQEQLNKFRKL